MEVLGRKISRVHAAALTLGALSALSGCAHHGHSKHNFASAQGGIAVSGSGEAHGTPDIARTTAGVEVRATTAEEATALAATQMQKLIDALKAFGIADRDLRTQGYSVSYERDYQPPPAPAPVRAAGARMQTAPAPVVLPGRYVVTNSVEITVRNVSDLGKVLSIATGAGANNVWGISFDIEDREPLVGKARELALAQAEARAAQVAELSGLTLGPIVSITDGSQGGGGVVAPFARMAMDSVPVERGELAVSHEVHVQYAIAGKAEHPHGGHPHHHPHGAPPAAPAASVPPVTPAAPVAPAVAPAAVAPAVPAAATVAPSTAPSAPVAAPVAPAPATPVPATSKPVTAVQPAPVVPPVPPLPAAAPAHVAPPSPPPAAPTAPAVRVQASTPTSTPLIVPAAAPAKAAPAAPATTVTTPR